MGWKSSSRSSNEPRCQFVARFANSSSFILSSLMGNIGSPVDITSAAEDIKQTGVYQG